VLQKIILLTLPHTTTYYGYSYW